MIQPICIESNFKMPRAAEGSHREDEDNNQINETSEEESISSDQEVVLNPQPSVSTNMYMPYIEGQQMDWTVNDGLYKGFQKWQLKCENILDCQFVMLSKPRKCKNVAVTLVSINMCLGIFHLKS